MDKTSPRIHSAVIDLITRVFNTHKKGLPEWMKNAREGYLRVGVDKREERLVIINYKAATNPRDCVLECIDFAGISGNDIEKYYIEWAKPDAAAAGIKSGEAEGGQGNGGKAYLREMFERGYFISICDKKLSVVSFTDKKKYILDFVPTPAEGKDVAGECPAVPNLRKYAADWLKAFKLPEDHNITISRGVGPKSPINTEHLVRMIQQFPQARHTIESCRVILYVNGVPTRELEVVRPQLYSNFPNVIKIPIPEVINATSGKVATTKTPQFGPGELELYVSAQPLQGQALVSWNRIEFYGQSEVKNIGSRKCEELNLAQPEYGQHLFGRCRLPLLVDPVNNYELQGRGPLNEGPLSEALYEFIAEEANKVLGQLQKHITGTHNIKKERNLEKLHERLVNWIEAKLESMKGFSETGAESGPGKSRKSRVVKIHEPAVRIGIHRSKVEICKGVAYDLRVVAYDAKDNPVPAGKVVWRSQASAIASVHPENGTLKALSSGIATVTVSDESGKLVSAPCIVQVYEALEITFNGKSPLTVSCNRRIKVEPLVKTVDNKTVKDPIVSWRTSDEAVASVGPDGWVNGGEVGDAEITAYVETLESVPLPVVVDKGTAGHAKGGGKGNPSILLSGKNVCPFNKTLVILLPTHPVVYQRLGTQDYDSNVFWINLQHPLAKAISSEGFKTLRWRTYHFQRIIDIYIKLMVRSKLAAENEQLTVDQVFAEIDDMTAKIYTEAKNEQLEILCEDEVAL